ncbi:MAG: hypothetical protein M0Q47_02360 [Methanothrix sp.]|uniref:hypothetical protein n=1 Tax=Methanothrix sp. TaxID=90426 RepID=UPI0025DAAA3C|nr:hypothetical protein [Methanothrix sp.]MCK9405242.1 hypothetical protein [Methanothrix sp.]
MRMQKEEKIVVVLLFMALGSLAAAFWAFGPEESYTTASGDMGSGENSRSPLTTLDGRITSVENTRSGGNLILNLDSTAMSVFIPASSGAKELSAQLQKDARVRITGTINSYQGKDELKVSRKADVQLLEG